MYKDPRVVPPINAVRILIICAASPATFGFKKKRSITMTTMMILRYRPVGFSPHHCPERFDVLPLRGDGADGDPNHPPAFQNRRCQISLSGMVDRLGPSARVRVQS